MFHPSSPSDDVLSFMKSHEPVALFDLSDTQGMTDFFSWDRDQGLWHEFLLHVNWDTPTPYEAAKWMLQQEDCENAIAALILHQLGFDHYLIDVGRPIADQRPLELIQMIVERDHGDGFGHEQLSDSQYVSREAMLERSLTAELKAKRLGVELVFETPIRTLQTVPTGPEPSTSYFIDECSVSSWVPKKHKS